MATEFGSDFYGLPEYFVQKVATETAAEGLLRAYHWSMRGGVLTPLFTAVLSAADLMVVTRDIREHALHLLARGSSH